MPKKSVQHLPRKQRLSSKDLTRLSRQKVPGTAAKYHFGEGWYLYKGPVPINYIGTNYVEAHQYIDQMPTATGTLTRLLMSLIR